VVIVSGLCVGEASGVRAGPLESVGGLGEPGGVGGGRGVAWQCGRSVEQGGPGSDPEEETVG
jgi:hypothetical protein